MRLKKIIEKYFFVVEKNHFDFFFRKTFCQLFSDFVFRFFSKKYIRISKKIWKFWVFFSSQKWKFPIGNFHFCEEKKTQNFQIFLEILIYFFEKNLKTKSEKSWQNVFRKKKSKWFFSTTKKYFSMIFFNLIYSLPVFECIRSQLLIPSGTSLTNLE